MKYLIAGLGNIGEEYANTRHNIGFNVMDALSGASDILFSTERYGDIARIKFKGRTLILLKPSTYMNLSGKAVNYWLQAEKIPIEKLLVVTDDLALPFGKQRLRMKGSDGGHNGLKSISQILGRTDYARLRIGVGDDFNRGSQIEYVLGEWNDQEKAELDTRIAIASETVKSFTTIGGSQTMTFFNNK